MYGLDVRRMCGALAVTSALTVFAGAAQAAPMVTIASDPGGSPGGYIPLALFGAAPLAVTNDSLTTFVTPDFIYAGETWNSISVGSNGFLVVGGGVPSDGSATNQALPNATGPNNVLAPFWSPNLSLGELRVDVLTDGVSSWIVFDWAAMEVGLFARYSFEAWIGINGVEDITFTYGSMSAPPALVTVGAEDKTGLYGAMRFYNGTGIAPTIGTELRVSTTDLPATVPQPVPEPTTMLLVASGLGAALLRRCRL